MSEQGHSNFPEKSHENEKQEKINALAEALQKYLVSEAKQETRPSDANYAEIPLDIKRVLQISDYFTLLRHISRDSFEAPTLEKRMQFYQNPDNKPIITLTLWQNDIQERLGGSIYIFRPCDIHPDFMNEVPFSTVPSDYHPSDYIITSDIDPLTNPLDDPTLRQVARKLQTDL